MIYFSKNLNTFIPKNLQYRIQIYFFRNYDCFNFMIIFHEKFQHGELNAFTTIGIKVARRDVFICPRKEIPAAAWHPKSLVDTSFSQLNPLVARQKSDGYDYNATDKSD